MKKKILGLCALLCACMLFSNVVVAAPPNSSNGTTLAAYKTLDICSMPGGAWRYFGEIAVWNEGVIDTQGLVITDYVEYKLVTGPKWGAVCTAMISPQPTVIPAGTTQQTATVFQYYCDATPPASTPIRNTASLTITNHSGHLGVPWGPSPKATYAGQIPPPPCALPPQGCTYTQGYWGNKPGVVWPDPYSRDATFFMSGKTWQQVMDTQVSESQGYYQLAHQFIAAVLNKENGAFVPQGVQDTLNLAEAWLNVSLPDVCTGGGSCGIQKDWAAVLDDFNNGIYPGGPLHCGDEILP